MKILNSGFVSSLNILASGFFSPHVLLGRGISAPVLFSNRRLWRGLILAFCGFLLTGHALSAGSWVPLAKSAPGGVATMMLLSDGTVMAANNDGFNIGNAWYRLTPDIHGSYVNGTWSSLASMHDTRLYYSSDVLRDGRVFVAGAEYGTGIGSAEVYDPISNTWTLVPNSGQGFVDSVSKILPDGNVLVAPVFPSTPGGTIIYNPTQNTWTPGGTLFRGFYQDEASWVKLRDDSILTIDPFGVKSERYIPSLNQWIDDGVVPIELYDIFLGELGPGFLLPDGRAFFLGSSGHTAFYTPTGNTNPGVWTVGPDIPNGMGFPDAPAAMMANGKILCVVSPAPVTNSFTAPTSFFEYDPVANSFASINGPTGPILAGPSFPHALLDLPDGNVLFSSFDNKLYVYQPGGAPLATGKPAIINIVPNGDGSYHLTGTKLNGISEGAAYGDDAQMNSNYPLVRMTDSNGNVYYARTYNWSNTGVQTGNTSVSTDFMVPAGLPPQPYSLVVSANGNSSDPVSFTAVPAPNLVILTNLLSGGNGNGIIDFNECNSLDLILTNMGSADATSVQATLSTSTPGVTISQRTASYPNIPINGSGINQTSFKVSTSPSFICGTTIYFTLVIKSAQNLTSTQFSRKTGIPGTPLRFDGNNSIQIPDNNPSGASSLILVSNISSAVMHVAVSLHINHTFDSDLSLQLIGPDGTVLNLSRNNGNGGRNYGFDCADAGRTIFDDDSTNSIANGNPPFQGTFQPEEPLAAFVGKSGTNVNGIWQLHVVDGAPFDVGSIQCWSLNLTPAVCADGGGPCPGVDLALGLSTLQPVVTVGSNLTYNITVTNLGPDNANGIVMNQTLPSGVTFISATSSQGTTSHSGNLVTCNLGNLNVGARARINVTVIPTSVGTAFSTATVGGTQQELDLSNNSATLSTLVVAPSSDLGVAMIATPNPVANGAVLTYTVSVTNNGPSAASSVVLTNVLPTSVILNSASVSQGTFVSSGNAIVCNLGVISSGGSAVVNIIVTPTALGAIIASATVAATQTDPVPGNNTSIAMATVSPAADLGVTLVTSPGSVIFGSNFLYGIIVTNRGPNTATGVTLNDTLPSGLGFISAIASQGTITSSGNFLTFNVGSLGNGGVATATITMAATNNGTFNSTVNVSASQADPNLADNSASVKVKVAAPFTNIVAIGAKLLSESIAPANGAIDVGETVTVSLALQNNGNVSSIPNLTATLQSGGGVTAPSGSQLYGALTPGGAAVSKPFTFTAAGTNGGTITATLRLQDGTNNLPSVVFNFPLPLVNGFANTNAIIIPDSGPASLYPSTIDVSGLTGLVGKITVTVTNLNHTFSDDVDMLLVGPAGQKVLLMSDAGGGGVLIGVSLTFDDAAGSFLPQSSQILSGSFKPSQYGPVNFPTNAPAQPYDSVLAVLNGSNPNGTWSLFVMDDSTGDAGSIVGGWSLGITTITPVNQVADLALTGISSTNVVLVTGSLTNTFTITNNGRDAASDIMFTNAIPANASFISAISSQGTCSTNGSNVICSLGNLAVGSNATVVVVVSPTAAGGITNQAIIGGFENDLNLSNNSLTLVSTANPTVADLGVAISAVPNPVVVGSNFTYTITVTNNGLDTALGVIVTDSLPGGLTFVSANPPSGTISNFNGTVTCNLGNLASGSAATVTIVAKATQTGTINNNVTVSSASNDPVTGNNSASVSVTSANPAPHITAVGAKLLAESLAPANGSIDPGETVTVSLTLTNDGSASTSSGLAAALQNAGGVSSPSGSQNYGALVPGGASATRSFSFTAVGTNGGNIVATIQLLDGTTNLGAVTFVFNLPTGASFANAVGITIPDSGPASPYPSSINITGMTGLVSKVTATLNNLNHAFPNDVNVLLVGPTGQKLVLMSGTGGGHSLTNVTLTFDDAAASVLPTSSQVVSGTFKPSNNGLAGNFPSPAPVGPYSQALLSTFNGTAPNGIWSLYVLDNSAGDAGNIAGGWSLSITTVNPINSAADLQTSVAGPVGTVSVGNFTYTVHVTNNGPAAASSAVLTDTLPPGLGFVSATPSQGAANFAGGAVICNLGTLAAGANATVAITVNSAAPGVFTNSATVTAAEVDLNSDNNGSQTVTTVVGLLPTHLAASTLKTNGSFQLTLTGQAGQTYVIQASTNLVNWVPIATNTLNVTGTYKYIDTNSPSFNQRYYRAAHLP
jgi:uncharacterized repeat protein (TIGR01451 family)